MKPPPKRAAVQNLDPEPMGADDAEGISQASWVWQLQPGRPGYIRCWRQASTYAFQPAGVYHGFGLITGGGQHRGRPEETGFMIGRVADRGVVPCIAALA